MQSVYKCYSSKGHQPVKPFWALNYKAGWMMPGSCGVLVFYSYEESNKLKSSICFCNHANKKTQKFLNFFSSSAASLEFIIGLNQMPCAAF